MLRGDLESARAFIQEREQGGGSVDLDLVERRALDVQRRFEEAQEELIIMEHQKEDDKIRLDVAVKEADEWRQVFSFLSRFKFNLAKSQGSITLAGPLKVLLCHFISLKPITSGLTGNAWVVKILDVLFKRIYHENL